MAMRVNRKELVELIESIEAGGGDASELRAELNSLEPPAKGGAIHAIHATQLEREEMTAEDRLGIEVGELFPGGIITGRILAEVIEFDRNHTLAELKKMCVEAGLSPSGAKKELAAKLIARGIK